jgi:cysteine desulfurase family protein
MIYLDNAATTMIKPPTVIEAVTKAMTSLGNAARGAHDATLAATRLIYETREKLAGLFGCPRPDHVVFTANSTESLNIAINGVVNFGDHVITTVLEHNSVLRPLYRLEKENGAKLDFVNCDAYGNVNLLDFEKLIRRETKVIVCAHASNLTGNIVDVKKIGEIAKRHGLIFIVDASQSAGEIPINIEEMNIDILCFTGHKALFGPQGTGGMAIREGVEIKPLKVGGTGIKSYLREQPERYPTRLEAGTLNCHGIAGLSAGIDFISETGLDSISKKGKKLTRQFYEGVSKIDGVNVYGDFGCNERAPIVAINIRDYDSSKVSDILFEKYGIATRPGAHCAPLMHMALGTKEQGAVRFSFSVFNTQEEVEEALRCVREIAG